MSSNVDEFELEHYTRHIPRILVRQLISTLTKQFITQSENDSDASTSPSTSCQTSMFRFQGALLFVDISGFTLLSQRLSVDDLRMHINKYFNLILGIVDKYNGDVIKFAGDALFILFTIDIEAKELVEETVESTTNTVKRALKCGTEICSQCSNYRIDFSELPKTSSPSKEVSSQSSSDHTFLNVHAGLAVGQMAGIDIGSKNRWEYFILGDPLSDVAKCENDAKSGELVVSSYVHSLVCTHPSGCNCTKTDSESFLISNNIIESLSFTSDASENQSVLASDASLGTEEIDHIIKFYENLMTDCITAFEKISETAISQYLKLIATSPKSQQISRDEFESSIPGIRLLSSDSRDDIGLNSDSTSERLPSRDSSDAKDIVFTHYFNWIVDCLLQDVVRHVHEADRITFSFNENKRINNLSQILSEESQSRIRKTSSRIHEVLSTIKSNSTEQSRHNLIRELAIDVSLQFSGTTNSASDSPVAFITSPKNSSSNPLLVSNLSNLRSMLKDSSAGISKTPSNMNYTRLQSVRENHHHSSEDQYDFHLPLRGIKNNDNSNSNSDETKTTAAVISPLSSRGNTPSFRRAQNSSSLIHQSMEQNMKMSSKSFVKRIKSLKHVSSHDLFRVKTEKKLRTNGNLSGELRNVITMFINVIMKAEDSRLVPCERFTTEDANLPLREFGFFTETSSRKELDANILLHYQACLERLLKCLKEKGGQLRQFIVDDKGTVCIGSFGLRGAVNYDNAAAAIEAANSIIHELSEVGIDVGIGLSLGSAYCGLVGAGLRHEYAVMGPAVNLSARLMGKAKRSQIICDANIRHSDRVHKFKAIGSVVAKGFASPIDIFTPIFHKAAVVTQASNGKKSHIDFLREKVRSGVFSKANVKKWEALSFLADTKADGDNMQQEGEQSSNTNDQLLFGREKEITLIRSFLLNTTDNSFDNLELHVDSPFRIAFVRGASGTGKSLFLSHFDRVLQRLITTDELKLRVFYSKADRFNQYNPFEALKSSFRNIFFHAWTLDPYSESYKEAVSRCLQGIIDKKTAKWIAGLDYLMAHIPPHMQQWKPLLSSSGFIAGIPENQRTKRLKAVEKLNKLCELLRDLLTTYVEKSGNLVFFIVDDCHYMDRFSVQLLQYMHTSHVNGVLFLGSIGSSESSISDNELLRFPPSVCLNVEIYRLDAESMREMVTHCLSKTKITGHEGVVFDMIERVSGGNPLYIHELTKGLIEKISQQTTTLSDTALRSILQGFKIQRVDEVILFRFDKLDSKSQLVLKMGAIASAANKGFTLDMLAAMTQNADDTEDDKVSSLFECLLPSGFVVEDLSIVYDTYRLAIAEVLGSILEKDEFLSIRRGQENSVDRDKDKDKDKDKAQSPVKLKEMTASTVSSFIDHLADTDNDVDVDQLQEYVFSFKVDMERAAIYNMMLKDLKAPLHERVAQYLEADNLNKAEENDLQPLDLIQEAFHWESSGEWGGSMTCYYQAAMMFDELGASKEGYKHIALAYNMLMKLQHDAGTKEIASRSFEEIIATIMNGVKPETLVQFNLERRRNCYKIFTANSDLLEVGLQLLLGYAQSSVRQDEDIGLTTRLYSTVLNLIFDTWRVQQTSDSFAASAASEQEAADHGETLLIREFHLKDSTILFRVLDGIAALYRTKKFQDLEHGKTEAALYGLIIDVSSSHSLFFIHHLHGLCLMMSFYFSARRYEEALEMAEKLRGLYELQSHSLDLVEAYGEDRVPHEFAKATQLLLLKGRFSKARQYIPLLMDIATKLSHLQSIGMIVSGLFKPLTAMSLSNHVEAFLKIYSERSQDKDTTKSVFSIFEDVIPLINECLTMKASHAKRLDSASLVAASRDRVCTPIQAKVVQREFLLKATEKASSVYYVMAGQGCSIQNLCAEILLMKAYEVLGFASVEEDSYSAVSGEDLALSTAYLRGALEYLDNSLALTGGRFVYSEASKLILKAKVLYLLDRVSSSPAMMATGAPLLLGESHSPSSGNGGDSSSSLSMGMGMGVSSSHHGDREEIRSLLRQCSDIGGANDIVYFTVAAFLAAKSLFALSKDNQDIALVDELRIVAENHKLISLRMGEGKEFTEVMNWLFDRKLSPFFVI